jgi:hypothetical protein
MKLEFPRQIFEKIVNFHKIRRVGAELFYADGQTDKHDETDGGFSQSCGRA